MKVKVRFNADDMLILTLLLFGAIIAVFGLYYAVDTFVDWLSGALTNINLNL